MVAIFVSSEDFGMVLWGFGHGGFEFLILPRPNKIQQHGRIRNLILPCHKMELQVQIKTLLSK